MTDKFQRYVWVNGERKRAINREKMTLRKTIFEAKNANASDFEEPQKAPNVIWPGQLEEQLAKAKNKRGTRRVSFSEDSAYIQTPDSIFSENENEDEDELDIESVEETPQDPIKKSPAPRKMSNTNIPDYSQYTDYYLQPPIVLNNHISTPFFLVTTNNFDKNQ